MDNVDSTRRDLLSLGAIGAGAALGAAILAPAAARADNATGLKIGLIDIGVIFKKYHRKDDLEKEINARKDGYEKQQLDQQKTLDGLMTAMSTIKEGSDLWRQKRKEYNLQMSQMKVIREGWKEELQIQIENLTLMILNEIENRVQKYGQDNKYDLIVKIDSQGWGDERFQERIFRAQVSAILYFRPELNVTDAVLAMLNDPAWIKICQDNALKNNNQPAPPNGAQPPK